MSDPGTIVGLVSLGIQVCNGLVEYYVSWKDCQKDIRTTISLLNNLRDGLDAVQKIVEGGSSNAAGLASGVSSCSTAINNLRAELAKYEAYKQSESLRNKLKTQARRLYYPFKESTLAKLREHVFEIKEVLDLTLNTSQLERLDNVADAMEHSNRNIQSIQKHILDSEIRSWLASPDPTTNQLRAREKHHARTGLWFLHDSRYSLWENKPNSFLWLQGFAGCGKTILCSTVIHHAIRYASLKPNTAVVFYYFDFTDPIKQTPEGFLRSLLAQLSQQCPRPPDALLSLYQNYKNSTAPIRALIDCSKDLINEFQEVFVVIDALDECRDRPKLLDGINSMRESPNDILHLLVTSRHEEDLVAGLQPAHNDVVLLQGSHVDDDIRDFIHERLGEDSSMQKWINHHEEIEQTLTDGANGMFRWVDCQLSTLKTCRNLPMLREALGSLPKTLDETYENILKNINQNDRPYALRILEFVCFSACPLTIEEVNDALAIELDEKPRFDPESRFLTAEEILYVCPSLLILNEQEIRKGSKRTTARIVQLAHFSVKEYLVSERIAKSIVSYFALSPCQGNETLCRKCLAYLDYFGEHEQLTKDNLNTFPLARYAAKNWPYHYKLCSRSSSLDRTIFEFFTLKTVVFLAWFRLFDPEGEWLGSSFQRQMPSGPYPLYYASYLGFKTIAQHLLESTDVRINDSVISDSESGTWSTTLCAAIEQGHRTIVQLLIAHGADVQTRARTGSPLSIAATSSRRDPEIITMLIQAGAQINKANFQKMTALHLATFIDTDNTEIVELLLQHGADVSAADSEGRTALYRAYGRFGSYPQRTRVLLAAGSNALHQDHYCQTPVMVYALKLLQRNFRPREFDSFLDFLFEFTNSPSPEDLRGMLTARTAGEVNELEGFLMLFESIEAQTTLTSVLAAAILRGSSMVRDPSYGALQERLVFSKWRKWLDRHNFNSTLYTLSHEKQPKAIEELLRNAMHFEHYNYGLEHALVHSSLLGDLESVRLLLEHGADPNHIVGTSMSDRQTALLVSIKFGHFEVVKTLLEHRVDHEIRDENGDMAIHLATRNGNLEIIKLLIDKHPKARDMKNMAGEDCLLCAASCGWTKVVQWLLDQENSISRSERAQSALEKGQESLHNTKLKSSGDGREERLQDLVNCLLEETQRCDVGKMATTRSLRVEVICSKQ